MNLIQDKIFKNFILIKRDVSDHPIIFSWLFQQIQEESSHQCSIHVFRTKMKRLFNKHKQFKPIDQAMESENNITKLQCVISGYKGEFYLQKKRSKSIKFYFNFNDTIRMGKFEVNDLSEEIKDVYKGLHIIQTLFEDIYDNQAADALTINMQGQLIMKKEIFITKNKKIEKIIALKTVLKELSEREMILNLTKKIKILEQSIENKKSYDELYSNLSQKAQIFEKMYLDLKKSYEEHQQSVTKKIEFFEKMYFEEKKLNKELRVRVERLEKEHALQIAQTQIERLQKHMERSYYFSSTLKGQNILLSKDGNKIEKINNSQYNFAMIENTLGKEQFKISFKIVKMTNWISFGLGELHIIKAKVPDFKHTSFFGTKELYSLITNSYSTHKNQATKSVDFPKFKTGIILDVTVRKNIIQFKQRHYEKIFFMEISYTAEERKDVCFYVCLYQDGETVEIVEGIC